MMTPLLIDALTISEGRFKKPCPVLVLKMMLLNGEKSRFSEEIKNQALLLLAIYRKLLLAVDRDLFNVKTLKNSVKRRHWAKVDKAQNCLQQNLARSSRRGREGLQGKNQGSCGCTRQRNRARNAFHSTP